MSSLSKRVHRIADQLPEDATWDDVRHLVDQHADEDKLEALRVAVRKGVESLDAGRYREFDSAHDLADHLKERTKQLLEAARQR